MITMWSPSFCARKISLQSRLSEIETYNNCEEKNILSEYILYSNTKANLVTCIWKYYIKLYIELYMIIYDSIYDFII